MPELLPLKLPKRPPRQLGGLERLFRHLDRPGLVVRSLIEGKPVAAAKHLAAGVLETPTLGLYTPHVPKFLETTKEEEPDWGIAGNIAFDPLTYLTLGGAGVGKAVGKATTRKVARHALMSGLTKTGGQYIDDLARTFLKTKPGWAAGGRATRIAKSRVMNSLLRKAAGGGYEIAEELTKRPGLLEQGGLRLGLPFGKQHTIAFAGQDILGKHPAVWGLKKFGQIPLGRGRTIGSQLGKTFTRHYGMSTAGKRLARKFENNVGAGKQGWDDALGDLLQKYNIQPNQLDDIAAAVDGVDARVLREATERTPEVVELARRRASELSVAIDADPALSAVKRQYADWMEAISKDELSSGLLKGTRVDPHEYLHRMYTPESLERYLGDRVAKGALPSSDFAKMRKFDDIGEAWLQGLDSVADPLERMRSRLHKHTYFDELRKLKLRAPARKDKVLSAWIEEGAGRLQQRGGLEKALAWPVKLWKKGVTTGHGPLINPGFHVRNLISGQWQGFTDEKIGARALRSLDFMWGGRISKLRRNLDNPDVLRQMPSFGDYSAEEMAALIKKHGILADTFTKTEHLMAEGGRGGLKKLAKQLDFSGGAMQGVEGQIRANGFVALLEAGVAPEEAAERVGKAFVDYYVASAGHRRVRDVFPFAQFTIGQTPTTLETVLRRPRFATPLRELYKSLGKQRVDIAPGLGFDMPGKTDTPPILPAWIRSQPTIPLGRDEQGRPKVLTQLGTIFDEIGKLREPGGLPETVRQTVLGSMTPIIKVPTEIALDKDAFFGTNLRYGRTPETLQAMGAGPTMDPRARKLLSLNPFTRQMSNVDRILSERESWIQKAANLLTGAKVYTVDENRALREIIRDYLEEKVKSGDAGVLERFYAKTIDPELAQLIRTYNRRK